MKAMEKCYCCGAKIEQDTAAFCPKCGKPLEVTAELTRRAAAGDSDAQTELYYRTYAAVYARIRSKVPDDDTAMDLMQDTYLRAFSHLEQLNEPAAFPGWILTIARNLTINWYKKHGKEKNTALFSESEFENEDNLSAEDDESASAEYRIDFMPEESLDRAETARLVSEILDELPEEQKIVLLMRYTEEMSIEEIAEELGISPNTVKTRLLRAKKKVEAKVLELERKGTKLYSLAPLPFLLFLLGNLEAQAPGISAAQALGTGVAAGVSASAGAGASTAAGTTATTSAAATTAASSGTAAATTAGTTAAATAGGVAAKGLGVKITAAALAVALAGGGGAVAYNAYTQANQVEPEESAIVIAGTTLYSGTFGDDLTWELDDNGTLIISGSGMMANVEVDGFNRTPWYKYKTLIVTVVIDNGVTDVLERAFDGCANLTSVTIGDSVTTIGEYTFNDCTNLIDVSMGNQVTSIDSSAFADCTSLTGISFPASLTSIGSYAFSGCTSLVGVIISDNVTSIGESAFSNCISLIGAATGNGVTYIEDSTFEGCSSMTSITIGSSVTSIGNKAFQGCSNLTDIIIPDGVVSIGERTFINCENLRSITLGKGLTSIGSRAFQNCDSLTDVYYDGTESDWASISIDSYNECLTSANIHR